MVRLPWWVGQVGYRSEDAISLYNLRARDYDPASGRFVSQDPLGLGSGDVNFYRCVANSPVDRRDPSGLDDQAQLVVVTDSSAGYTSTWLEVRNAADAGLYGLNGYVATKATFAGPDIYLREHNGKAYCATFSRIVIAVRNDEVKSWNDWESWFVANGFDCQLGKPKPPQRPTRPPTPAPSKKPPTFFDPIGPLPGPTPPCDTDKLHGGDCRNVSKEERDAWLNDMMDTAEQLQSLLLDFAPGIGTLKGLIEALSGRNEITDEDLLVIERILAVIAAIPLAGAAAKGLAGPVKKLITSLLERLLRLLECAGPRAKELKERILKLLKDFWADESGGIPLPGGGNKPKCPRITKTWPR